MADPRVKIVIEAEDKGAGRTIAGAGNSLTQMGDKAVAAGQKMSGLTGVLDNVGGRLDSFGQKMSSWGGNLSLALTAPLVAIGTASVGLASDLGETESKVDVIFGKMSDSVKTWADNAADAMGVSTQEAEGAAATFGGLFKTMGVGATPTLKMSENLVQLSSDLASFNNLDPTEVMGKLKSGLVGEAEPLRGLGIVLDAAAVKQEAYRLGLAKVGTEVSQAGLLQARYSLIMQQTRDAQGDFARTSDGLANSQRTVKAEFKDIGALLGGILLPTIGEGAGLLKGFLHSVKELPEPTLKWAVGLGVGAAAIGPVLLGVGKLTSLIGVALPLLGSVGPVVAGIALPLGLLYGAYRLNIGGLKTFVDTGLNRIVKAAPLAGDAVRDLVAQLTGVGINTYDSTEEIEAFVRALTGSEQAGINAGNMIANLGDKMAAARVSFAQAGGGLNGLMAGLGNLTGGSVEISVKSKVTSVDWTTALGDTSYTYDAKADIYSIDWLGKSGATESYTYNAKAGIASIDWNYGTQGSLGFVYDAKAGIQSVDWRAKDLTVQYDAKAGVTEVYFFNGLFTGNYTATASVTSVLWGAWTNQYNATAQISDTSVLWGTYTHTYNARAGIDQASIFWGAATHSYTVSGVVGEASVLWGAYTHSYQVSGAIGQTGIAWGAWTHTYNALAGIDSTRIAWGAWTHSYNASAQVSQNSILWGAFTYTYDAKANVTSWTIFGKSSSEWVAALSGSLDFTSAKLPEWKWPEYLTFTWPTLPAFTWPALPAWSWPDIPTPSWLSSLLSWRPSLPSFLGGGSALPGNATGTSSWRGGVTSLGERGWELLQYPNGQWAQVGVNGPIVSDVPAGTKIYSHEDAIKMMSGGAGIMPIAMNAAGTTKAPVIPTGYQQVNDEFVVSARIGGKETIDAAKKAGRIAEAAAQKASDTLKAGLQSTPGLFHTSQVTQQQMDLAKLGVPQNFADDWIRHLTDEVVNGVQWSDADIKDAATRAGIDPSLPAKAILDMVTQKWNDSSLFADKKNLDLINVDAVKKNLADQAAAQAGQANIMAMFGIKPEQVQAQAAAVGAQWSAGIAQGAVTASTGTDGKAGTSILGSIAGGMTPEAFASMAGQLSSGLLAAIGDDKSTANADLAAIGPALLGKISDSWANVTGIDLISKLAGAINLQLGTDSAIQTLKDMGGKIFKIVFEGWDLAASGADYVSPMASASSKATKKDPLIPGNATGTTNWRGGLTWVGENGPELVNLSRGSQVFSNQRSMAMAGAGGGTVNNYYTTTVQATVDNTIDIQELAYRVAAVIQRKAGG